MKRWWIAVAVTATAMMGLAGTGEQVQAKAPGPNGRIAFTRQDPTCGGDCSTTFTVNPDGSHVQKLLSGTCCTNWSPDGTEISFLAECSFGGPCSAAIVNPDTGNVRTLPNPDPSLYNEFFSCNRWSPDGSRLACAVDSDTPGFTGLYTIRSSDGGDLTKVLSCSDECGATDWSPDGKRLVLAHVDPSGQYELFVVRLNGTGLHQITPSGMPIDWESGVANWSPTGNPIVFAGQADPDHRRTLFVVNADGSDLHQVPIPGCGLPFSDPRAIKCKDPSWSPDGTKIVFARTSPRDGTQAVYTVNADGTGLSQVTTATNLEVSAPDWGPHPLAT
jgi:TolB protein